MQSKGQGKGKAQTQDSGGVKQPSSERLPCICRCCLSANTALLCWTFSRVSLPLRRSLNRCYPLENKTKPNKAKRSTQHTGQGRPHTQLFLFITRYVVKSGRGCSFSLCTPSPVPSHLCFPILSMYAPCFAANAHQILRVGTVSAEYGGNHRR